MLGFHPLKSGRDQVKTCTRARTDLVSIPSSRVGTRALPRRFLQNCRVSIPSSRVGTGLVWWSVFFILLFPSPQVGSGHVAYRHRAAAGEFPSPQVGSGPVEEVVVGGVTISFHPLKSGRDPPRSDRLRPFLPVSIPSSRVGTASDAHFHSDGEMFPSPQVGSGRGERLEKALPAIGFHPLKSGRDERERRLLRKERIGFHPLKSGRDRWEIGGHCS